MHVFVYRGDGVCMYRTDINMCICSEETCKWDRFMMKNWFIYIVNDQFITENILKHKIFSWCLCLYGATTHTNATDRHLKVICKYYTRGTYHREHSPTQDVLLMSVCIWSNSTRKCDRSTYGRNLPQRRGGGLGSRPIFKKFNEPTPDVPGFSLDLWLVWGYSYLILHVNPMGGIVVWQERFINNPEVPFRPIWMHSTFDENTVFRNYLKILCNPICVWLYIRVCFVYEDLFCIRIVGLFCIWIGPIGWIILHINLSECTLHTRHTRKIDIQWCCQRVLAYVCIVAVCCGMLQCTALFCSVLQCVAVCCSVVDSARPCMSTSLQCVAVCCSALQCVAVRCSAVDSARPCSITLLQFFVVCWIALQCIAVHCRVLQCRRQCLPVYAYIVAVFCSVLQRCSGVQCSTVYRSVLQGLALCCIVLHCVALFCTVMQRKYKRPAWYNQNTFL